MDRQQHIILVSPFFYPELISTGKANQFLAEALAADGHRVTVVCSHPLYPAWVPFRSSASIKGIKILRGGSWVRYPKAMPLRRMLLEAWFALYACWRVWSLRKRADIVVSVIPPSFFALLLHRLLPRRTRRVAVIHDLQGVLAAQEQSPSRKAIIRSIHAVESRAFRAQDVCIFFSADMAEVAQRSYGIHPDRMAVQYPFLTLPTESEGNGHDAKDRLESVLPADAVHVVYSGALGYKQNSRELVSLMQAAAKHFPHVQFHIFSGGPLFEELREAYRFPAGPSVQFHSLVEQRDLAELYARSAIQIIPQAERTEVAALPSKLPNLLAAGVYLLAICSPGSEVEKLIDEAGTGSIVERWDETLFLNGIGNALEAIAHEPASVRRARVAQMLERFSVSNLVSLILGKLAVSANVTKSVTAAQAQSDSAVLVGRDHEG
jgi:colanic acid biosynthesis glycosyl transferase WcaI